MPFRLDSGRRRYRSPDGGLPHSRESAEANGMRSAASMAAVTALFVATLFGGRSYTGRLDPALLRGRKDHAGEKRAGWKTRSMESAGCSIQLPPAWELKKAGRVVVFEARDGKTVLATLSVSPAPKRTRTVRSVGTKRYLRGDRLLTFSTTSRRVASFARVFDLAASSFE